MIEFLEQIGNASIWPFWVPVLFWTGVAGAGALLLARARGLHPLAGYRMRQAVLLALPVSVLAAPWMPSLWVPPIWAPAWGIANDMVATVGLATPSITPTLAGAVDTTAVPPTHANLTAVILGLATVAVVLLAVTRLAVLGADLRQLRRLRLFAPPVDDPAPRRMLRELSEQLGVRRPVALLEGPPDSAPMTFGAWRPVIVVPRALLGSPRSLRTVLAHELVHIRRADYVWALLDQLTAAAFAFHPLVWLLRRGIERSRETSCDAEVLARGFVRPKPYAELLAHTHTPTQFPMPAVAASLSAPSLKLKERLETMKNFAHKRLTSRQRVGIVLGAGLVCVVVAIAGACATRTEENAPGGWEAIAQAVASNGEISAGVVARLSDETGISESEVLTRLRESVEIFEIEGSPQGPYFTIPRLTDESISYYYNATEEDVLLELKRLDVQIQYLQEQIDETMATLDRLAEPGRDAERFWVGTEEYESYSRASAPFKERLEFLKSMRSERVRVFEVLKLEYETQKRMGDSRPAAAPGRGGNIF